jgi:hypothetical protein
VPAEPHEREDRVSADVEEAGHRTPEDKASGGIRALAVVAGIVLLFGAAVMFVLIANPDNLPLCSELKAQNGVGECFDLSRAQYNISRVVAAPAGVLAALAGLLGFYVAVTGRRWSLMLRLGGAAVVLAAIAVLINRAL